MVVNGDVVYNNTKLRSVELNVYSSSLYAHYPEYLIIYFYFHLFTVCPLMTLLALLCRFSQCIGNFTVLSPHVHVQLLRIDLCYRNVPREASSFRIQICNAYVTWLAVWL